MSRITQRAAVAGVALAMLAGCAEQTQGSSAPPTTDQPSDSVESTAGASGLDVDTDDFGADTVVGVLAADGRFEIFLGLLEEHSPLQLGLIGAPRFNHSLLAPTDDAFATLSEETLSAEFTDDIKTRDFFHRHIITGAPRTAEDLMMDVQSSDGFVPALVGSGLLLFGVVDEALTVVLCEMNGSACEPVPGMEVAHIVEQDIEASNGLIHVIDGVLMSPKG